MKKIKRVITFLVMFTGIFVASQKALPFNQNNEIDFWIKPSVCVLSQLEEHCEDSVDIIWTSPSAVSACLWKDLFTRAEKLDGENKSANLNEERLRCWENEKNGRYTLNLIATESVIFYLKEIEKERFLASQTFKVIQDTQRFRRRHRNPWSFF